MVTGGPLGTDKWRQSRVTTQESGVLMFSSMLSLTMEIDESTQRCLASIVELEGAGLRTAHGEVDFGAALLHVLRASGDGHSFAPDCPECTETLELQS